jgi:hypothetical protein
VSLEQAFYKGLEFINTAVENFTDPLETTATSQIKVQTEVQKDFLYDFSCYKEVLSGEVHGKELFDELSVPSSHISERYDSKYKLIFTEEKRAQVLNTSQYAGHRPWNLL